jgi:hypothetical protein
MATANSLLVKEGLCRRDPPLDRWSKKEANMKSQFLLAGVLVSLFAMTSIGVCHGGLAVEALEVGAFMAVVREIHRSILLF